MRVLTVLDHPNPESFSAAVAARFMAGARAAGHQAVLADLHAEGFDPRWTLAEAQGGAVPADVRREQGRVERADALCMVFPLYWWGMPAMSKGWLERVFSYGWAYDQLDDPEGSLLRARPMVGLVPAGARSDAMAREGYTAALELLWNRGTFGYFGFSPRKLEFLNGSTGSEARREALLQRAYAAGREIGAS
ncbi:MAG: NAD(P)H dehydrogenase [Rhodobacterales bacterium]|nr:MAG: NAD(P)H dehydrogenase [Rhodobacterales bacterium]PIE09235.1 MAG: NAD(P)H dehydrogenase [Rhodobacterales bacterium]